MPRKKTLSKTAAIDSTENTATAVIDADARPLDPVVPPAWIDGAPVDVDGRIIRDHFPQPTAQLDLASPSPRAEVQPVETPAEPQAKNWGEPYKTVFSCPDMGFELGEDRRFKQRVFRFDERPTTEILSALKEHGFIYRAAEKAWTVSATPQSRKLTDDLARTWAGSGNLQGVER